MIHAEHVTEWPPAEFSARSLQPSRILQPRALTKPVLKWGAQRSWRMQVMAHLCRRALGSRGSCIGRGGKEGAMLLTVLFQGPRGCSLRTSAAPPPRRPSLAPARNTPPLRRSLHSPRERWAKGIRAASACLEQRVLTREPAGRRRSREAQQHRSTSLDAEAQRCECSA